MPRDLRDRAAHIRDASTAPSPLPWQAPPPPRPPSPWLRSFRMDEDRSWRAAHIVIGLIFLGTVAGLVAGFFS
jgi:hypothetical protein